jgi:hypothetical protein
MVLVSLHFIPTQTRIPAMPFGNWLRKDALCESRNRQEQNEALTKALLDFTEGIGIIKTTICREKSGGATRSCSRRSVAAGLLGTAPSSMEDLTKSVFDTASPHAFKF